MNLLLAGSLLATFHAAAPAEVKLAHLKPVSFTEVKIADKFWAPRQETNRKVSIPHVIDELYETPRMENLIRAGKREKGGFKGLIFDDSDVYKVLESAAYALAEKPDPKLEKRVDEMIAILAKAQMADGYLNSWYQLMAPDKRFTNLADNHELYCAGHLFEAAVAHFKATGKKSLLNVATKYADLLVRTFGNGPGQRMGYGGHPESELALFKLADATGNKAYFNLAKFFIDNRGSRFFADEKHIPKDKFDGVYWLDDVPVREHREIKGHAVRAAYLFSGIADLANATDDPALVKALDRVWKNTVYKRVFVTGGIGPSASNEGFTTDYDLPTFSAYQESCASLAMVFWNHRMGLLHGDGKYWDEVERSLYNSALAGINLKGDKFFYVNPLGSYGGHHRQSWFSCACCPPNITRTLASLGGYAYAKSDDALYVNLFIAGEVETQIGKEKAKVQVETNYPWDGKLVLRPSPGTYQIHVRIPNWVRPAMALHEDPNAPGYATFVGPWKQGSRVEVNFGMPVKRVLANPGAKEIAGRAVIQRGPLIYALEQVDNKDKVLDMVLPLDAVLTPKFEGSLLGGVTVLNGKAILAPEVDWRNQLYAQAPSQEVPVTAIPYYTWDNREPGPMAVWLPYAPPSPPPGGLERLASVKLSYLSDISRPNAIKDGKEIAGSNKHPGDLCHFWPHKGTDEYVEYTWAKPQTIKGTKLYWFDDTGFGECRPPAKWEIQYLVGSTWKPVSTNDVYSVSLDKWIEIDFPTLKTTGLRLVMKLQPNWSVGIHEWQVIEGEDED
ncbi:MAG: glycoside hydrolase family 127 protein [Fimbriimonadaceae bacterium]|nr:glycoside hydrolase family 127 protein [Fimbriimonadaceae bacterium]